MMRKVILGLLFSVFVGILPVLAHEPVDVGAYNSVISVKVEKHAGIIAEVKVQAHEGDPYNIMTYQIDRGQQTITLLENKSYDAAGTLKMTDNTRWKWTYSHQQKSEQALHDCIYEAAVKWADEEKKINK